MARRYRRLASPFINTASAMSTIFVIFSFCTKVQFYWFILLCVGAIGELDLRVSINNNIPFHVSLSRTTWASLYQKGKSNLYLWKQEIMSAVALAGPYVNLYLTPDS